MEKGLKKLNLRNYSRFFLNQSMVFNNPSFNSILGSQFNKSLANSIEGFLCFGSSWGSFLYSNSNFGFTRVLIKLANYSFYFCIRFLPFKVTCLIKNL